MNQVWQAVRRWGVMGLVVVLAACGGGGGDSGDCLLGCDDGDATASVADVRLDLSATSVTNNGTDKITATVTAVDERGVVVPNAELLVSVNANAEATVSSSTTGTDGKLTAQIGPGGDRSNRVVTVTASSADGSIRRSKTFSVTGATLTATAVPGVVTPGSTGNLVEFVLKDATANAMADESITITSASLSTVTGTTGTNGEYALTYTAPTTTGNLVLTATAAGTTFDITVLVQDDTTSIPDVTPSSVLSATASANPSVVTVNATGGTTNRTEVRALFLGASNARIPNVRVRFELPDPNSVGGTLSTGSNIVYADATGVATTAYIPGAVSSPTNGVVVRACWGYNDAELANAACPRSTSATLTVTSEALRVSIGRDEEIQKGTGTYFKDFPIIVVDAAGRARADVEITPSLDLLGYHKGFYFWNGDAWEQVITTDEYLTTQADEDGNRYDTAVGTGPYLWTGSGWTPAATRTQAVCPNEDVNRNGIRENGEDLNGSSELEPAGVSISVVGSPRTDATGLAIVRLEYPRDRATWIDYRITITASVGGSEGRATYTGTRYGRGALPALGDDVTDENVAPAFVVSPYGRTNDCTTTD